MQQISENIRESIQRHHAFYEIVPYCVLIDERPLGKREATRVVKAGFDIDIYAAKLFVGQQASAEYTRAYETLRNIASTVSRHTTDFCRIETIPFYSTVYLDPRNNYQSQILLRIRITHGRGLDQPAAESEERVLRAVQEELERLGLGRK